MSNESRRFGVYWVNLDPTVGKEIKKTRPCVVISPDEINKHLDTVIVAPITTTIRSWPFRLTIKSTGKLSSIACDQIRTVSKQRLGKYVGNLSTIEQKQLASILNDLFVI